MTYEEFLKRYQFDQQDKTALLGVGGFSSVYKAYDTIQKRSVAVKIAEVKHEKFNLLYEKQIVDELDSHENVARYGNCFRFQFMPVRYDFAVLTFYEEGNLADVLGKYALTLPQKREILRGILSGVGHLHEHHIIHRDMKPQNVLMDRKKDRWIPKLTDFGLSKLTDSTSTNVDNSSIGLSIAYAAPEQIQNREIRPNVDLWAVGVIAYQMFVGEQPFEAPRSMSQESWNIQVSQLIVKAEVPAKISSVPEPYRTIIKKCLVADNKLRAQKADELIVMLDTQADGSLAEEKNLIDDATLRRDEPIIIDYKEPLLRADGMLREASGMKGAQRQAKLNDAIKAYNEILVRDPKNARALAQIEICRKQLLPDVKPTPIPFGKFVTIIACIIAGIGFLYFFYWRYTAKKELSWAKATYFSKILYADTLETYKVIFSTLDKYSGTVAMDDTTNYMLGYFYQTGRGGAAVDNKKAMDYFEDASDYEWGEYSQGYLHFWGKDTKKDYEKAVPHFKEAYNKKQLIDAANYLGYIYLVGGHGVIIDYHEAKSWLEKAALGNSSYSQYQLGRIYLNGMGVPVNQTLARHYFDLAARQGNQDARQLLYNMDNNKPSVSFGTTLTPNQLTITHKSNKNKGGKNAGAFWEKAAQDIIKNAFRR
jgi:serine/threonine protein kinase/TPR repeat protein